MSFKLFFQTRALVFSIIIFSIIFTCCQKKFFDVEPEEKQIRMKLSSDSQSGTTDLSWKTNRRFYYLINFFEQSGYRRCKIYPKFNQCSPSDFQISFITEKSKNPRYPYRALLLSNTSSLITFIVYAPAQKNVDFFARLLANFKHITQNCNNIILPNWMIFANADAYFHILKKFHFNTFLKKLDASSLEPIIVLKNDKELISTFPLNKSRENLIQIARLEQFICSKNSAKK